MSDLPDELWLRIMEIGIESKTLDCKNLCSISLICRQLHHLSADDSLWSKLLCSELPFLQEDYPKFSWLIRTTGVTAKSICKFWYEKAEGELVGKQRTPFEVVGHVMDILFGVVDNTLRAKFNSTLRDRQKSELLAEISGCEGFMSSCLGRFEDTR